MPHSRVLELLYTVLGEYENCAPPPYSAQRSTAATRSSPWMTRTPTITSSVRTCARSLHCSGYGPCSCRTSSMPAGTAKIDLEVQQLRARFGSDIKDSPVLQRKDMHPIPLPLLPPDTTASFIEEESVLSADTSFRTAVGELSVSHTMHSEVSAPDPFVDRHVSPPPVDEHALYALTAG
ncbi:hypothetical protein OH77DRAFT_1424683 [Trametes cingulata]|nr:hypothetical protein OH77DRAFT_1424683 [Trametes cingulata]